MWLRVMISYSRRDRDLAEKLVCQLENYRINVWIDKRLEVHPVDFEKEIAHQIRKSDAIILLVSNASAQSQYVRREYDYACELGKKIVFVQITNDISNVPDDWLVHNFLPWREEEGVLHIITVLGDIEVIKRLQGRIWQQIRRIIMFELPQTALNLSQIQPLYAHDGTLAVQAPDDPVIVSNEEKICRIIERELARYSLTYTVELHFPGRI